MNMFKKIYRKISHRGIVNFYLLKDILTYGDFIKERKKTSDSVIYEQIFIKKEYNYKIDFVPKIIIDAGANVGYSAIFFARKFKDAKIYAIEPEKSNFEVLIKNTKKYKNIKSFNFALWDKNTKINLIETSFGKCGFVTEKIKSKKSTFVKSLTINKLIKDNNIDVIDILKIDIEGSEKEIFSKNFDWLSKVKLIFIELHENIRPGCTKNFLKAISNYDCKIDKIGENLIVEFNR
ncbi:MAG: FkbM family methyltransferase [Candidatus ainarchaeum sp.]|nr:FkbM family methyltransferase [Candidatus ainarchaeum sp.]